MFSMDIKSGLQTGHYTHNKYLSLDISFSVNGAFTDVQVNHVLCNNSPNINIEASF